MSMSQDISELTRSTYHCLNIEDHTLDDNDLERGCPLDCKRHQVDPIFYLGNLDRLPLELVTDILVAIDLRSLMDFRRVNQRALQVVDSMPQFQSIIKNCPAVLRGMLSVRTAPYFSCRDRFCALQQTQCSDCLEFAGYIYVLGCRRVCFACFCYNARYRPLLRSEAARSFGIDRRLVSSLPSMKSIPGRYAPSERLSRTRLVLVDHEAARLAGVAAHGSVAAMEQYLEGCAAETRYEQLSQAATAGSTARRQRRPPGGSAPDDYSSNPRRFMAIVRAPSVHSKEGPPVWGFYCVGCKGEYSKGPMNFRRMYDLGTFAIHMKKCGPIKDGRHSSGT